ncbi:MAG: hypothetical protein M3167_08655 [Acidobacteriota bacterium]|nr:hypothetical protein [Acidobacteriota bacterium]
MAVWEPILITDMSKPGSIVLRRLRDPRVRHFWDHDHRIADQLRRQADPSQGEPECCSHRGTLWDLAALYPARDWTERLPRAGIFDGPVVAVIPRLDEEIQRLESGGAK